MPAKDELGRRGEDLAAHYLEQRGLVVLSRNWRCRDGELDIVATDTHRVVVCEVKTRTGTSFGDPHDAVTPRKAARIRRATTAWLAAHHVAWCELRFDVIAIVVDTDGRTAVRHYEAAF